MKTISIALSFFCLTATPLFSQSSTVATFDGGSNEGFTGNAFYEATQGNPGGNAHHFLQTTFPTIRTGGINEPVNPAFVGDFSNRGPVTFSFDVKVNSISSFGNPIARPTGIRLIDRDIQGPSGPSGVFFTLATLSSTAQGNWTELTVTIDDPTSTSLLTGWVGFGDEDPNTFEPILPTGATFATVLAGVDEFAITGAIPGFVFGFADFDIRIDNVSVDVCDSGSLNYCAAGMHSGGGVASIGDLGVPSIFANNYSLSVTGAPANQFGLFYFGPQQVQTPFGDGFRCVGGMITRLAPAQITGMQGTAQRALDFTTYPQITAGSNWNFQFWFRDPGGPGGSGFNLSDGLSVTFCN